jgi:hypothetical protein
LAKTAVPSPPAPDARPSEVAVKAAAVADVVARLRADLVHSQEMLHQAQVREALSRTELTLALTEALAARSKAEAALGAERVSRYLEAARPQALRRRRRLDRVTGRLLVRLGRSGWTRIVADSGVWRGGDLTEIAAYVRRGADPGAQPAALFDQAWYLATYPEAAASGLPPLVHYLVRGAAAGYAPHPLLHADYYRQHNAGELAAEPISVLEHYVRRGAALGRDPHPAFDAAHYVAQGPELAAGEDPVSHYLRAGWRDGLSPHPLFDAAWYRRQMPRKAANVAPLVHYLTAGWREGLTPHPLFDSRWYLEQNPDVAEIGAEPLTHFLTSGSAEGRSPSPWFDTAHYVAARGAALDAAANPLVDYLRGGAWAVAEARPGFPTAAYIAQSPELVGQGMTPLEHWARKAARP